MRTFNERRSDALRAIDSVLAGGTADENETQTVDFKEESGSRDKNGNPQQITSKSDAAAAVLAGESACMANTLDGGVLVVGVADDRSGSDAFIGAQSDGEWLRERIWELTQPNLAVEIEEYFVAGKRLLLINVPDALEEVRHNGKLRTREGKKCVELSGDKSRLFVDSRNKFDWSGESSSTRLSEADPEALTSARRHYTSENGIAPGSDRELANRLGVLYNNDEDPELNIAGSLLLCSREPELVRIYFSTSKVAGVASERSYGLSAPLLPAFDLLIKDLLVDCFPSRTTLPGRQRTRTRVIPERVIREAIINAIMHRDYRSTNDPVHVAVTGAPSNTLKVTSPGGLLPNVRIENLISTPSKARNPALAHALHVLGLAEREGVGVDTMYREMMRQGNPEPEISEQSGSVVVQLTGGFPEERIVALFDEIELKDNSLSDDVRAVIAVTHLLRSPTVRPEKLAELAQCSKNDAIQVLIRLEGTGRVDRLLNGSQYFRLTGDTKTQLGDLVKYLHRSKIEEQAETILSYLDSYAEISKSEIAVLLGVSPVRANQIAAQLIRSETLGFVDKKLGRNVTYKKSQVNSTRNKCV